MTFYDEAAFAQMRDNANFYDELEGCLASKRAVDTWRLGAFPPPQALIVCH